MEYADFLSYIEESIGNIVGKEGRVQISTIIKNNDLELNALTVLHNSKNISPTIYLNDYYDEYLNGRPINEIVYDIYSFYEEHSLAFELDMSFFMNFENVSGRVLYKLINFDSNTKLLSDVPHIRYLDLAIVFYCIIENDSIGRASTLIHTSHLDLWGISEETLMEHAINNTPVILPSCITPISSLIRQFFLSKLQEDLSDNLPPANILEEKANEFLEQIYNENAVPMYVLTNTSGTQGAICILYDNVLKEFSNSIDSNLYIIPSSIHEVILVPYSDNLSVEELNLMVSDVNTRELSSVDILSNHIYLYDRDNDRITSM